MTSVLRSFLALLAVLGLVFGLSACRVQPGAAAFVGDDKISESDLEGYLLDGGPTQPAQAGQPSAREYALTYLIRLELYRDYFQRAGIDAGTSAVDAARTKVTTGQEQAIAQLPEQAAELGLTPKFVDLLIDFAAFQGLAGESAGSTDAAAITAKVNDGAPRVELSPRYGKWASEQESVTPDSTVPDYLQLEPATSA
ncbi:hypothetical protein ACXR2U_22930 [Jatrophihabitans sp. YIM 134969]